MKTTGYTAAGKHREARELRDEAKDVGHEIGNKQRQVAEAERLQLQFAAESRGDRARSAAAIVAVQRLKTKARKEIDRMSEEKNNLEKQANEAEKKEREVAQQEKEQQEKQRERTRRRSRGRDNDRDQDHDRDPF